MTDIFTSEKRSAVMSRIRSKDTKPEMAVRRALHGMGYRYRLHQPNLAGRPDIVLPRHGVVILVHGCFWHHHSCTKGRLPSQSRPYWEQKLGDNVRRDRRCARRLRADGWSVRVIWECDLRRMSSPELAERLQRILAPRPPALLARSSASTQRRLRHE